MIRVSGRPPFSAHHVGIIARFRPGDQFQRSKIDDLRRALIATTLVANADIKLVPVQGGRVVDLDVRLEPAPSHTIAGEVGYGTGQGFSVEGSWTDRNFFNPEGALTLRGILGSKEQLAGVELRRSNFLQRDQTLDLQLTASHQKFDAYEARTVSIGGHIERLSNFIWQKKWTWSYGALFLATDERGVFSPAGIKDTRTFFIAARAAHASAMTAATICSIRRPGSASAVGSARNIRGTARASPMSGRRSTRAPIIRCPTMWSSRVACGSARSLAPAISISHPRGAFTRAAEARFAATAISSSGRRTWTATRSADAASPSLRSKRVSA